MLVTPSTRNSMNIKLERYRVEGGGTFLFFRRGWTKRTKKVAQNLQESDPKPSRKWVKKTKETEELQADLSRRFTPPAEFSHPICISRKYYVSLQKYKAKETIEPLGFK
jgi:hypothetical protein